MTSRQLYLIAYDIAAPRRLQQALDIAKSYATGGQKSVFECYLSEAEKRLLRGDLSAVLDEAQDRLMLVQLDPRSRVHTLGLAVAPIDPDFFYHG